MSAKDFELLGQWQTDGNAQAFREITRLHAAMVFGTCRRLLGNSADAEEVTQDCFLRLARSQDPITKSLGGWLHTLATRRSLDRVRGNRRRIEREHQYAVADDIPEGDPWESLEPLVDECIAELAEDLREPIVAYFLEEKTQAEIAAMHGVTQATISRRIEKGIGEIRDALKQRGVSVPLAALGSLLGSRMAEAVPLTLTPALGKLAIAGRNSAAKPSSSPTAIDSNILVQKGILIMSKKSLAGIVSLLLVLMGAVYFAPRLLDTRSDSPEEIAALASAESASTEQVARSAASSDSPEATLAMNPETRGASLEDIVRALLNRNAGAPKSPHDIDPIHSWDIPRDNGMHHFLLAWERFIELDDAWNGLWIDTPAEDWINDPRVLDSIANAQEVFDLIRQGLEVGNIMMPVGTHGIEENLPYLARWRAISRLMAMEARIFEAQGNTLAAYEGYTTLIEFANQFPNGSVSISGLVGYAVSGIGISGMRDSFERGTAGVQEYQFAIHELQRLEREGYSPADLVLGEAELVAAWFDAASPSQADLAGILPSDVLESFATIEMEVQVRALFEDYDLLYENARQPFYLSATTAEQALSTNPLSQFFLSEPATLVDLQTLNQVQAWRDADLRGTVLMAAVELHRIDTGLPPQTLSELVPTYLSELPRDPFSGENFGYSALDDDYLLYAVGTDREDNQGTGTLDTWRTPSGDMVIHGNGQGTSPHAIFLRRNSLERSTP